MPRLLTRLEIDDGGFYRSWSCEEVLKRRTVVFGRNGSGKSTLVRHLRNANPSGSVIKAETDLEILVFNAEYVDEHLGGVFTGSGLSSALFVTGEVNVEIEAELKAATERRNRLDRLAFQASRILRSRQRVMKKALDTARDHVRALPGESGSMQAPKAEERLRKADPCSDDDDSKDRQTLTRDPASIPDSVDGIPDDLVNIDISEVGEVLARDVAVDASSALSSLTSEQRSWVEKGAELHEHRDTCLLCENALVPPRSELLAAMRTQELLQLRGDLERFSEALETQTNVAESLAIDLATKTKQIDTSAVDPGGVANELRAVGSYLKTLLACVAQKLSQPQERVEMPSGDQPSAPLFDQLRLIIYTQNERWEQERIDLDAQKELAAARCLGRLCVTHLPEIDKTKTGATSAQERVNSLEAERDRLDERIKEIQARRLQTDDAKPLAEQLTRDLRSYLGHNEITVRVDIEGEATGFALYRSNGHRASGLSEGERTAISLLHFITSLQESDRLSELRETCIVLDDPVSSLDGQSLRNAFHFIVNALHNEDGADKVGQYLICTHSETFFGLWRDKLTNNLGTLSESSALLRLDARQSQADGQRVPILEAFPPGAIKYRSEYYRLFDQVVVAVEQRSNFIDQGVANVARRLMESFVRWKVPNAANLTAAFIGVTRQVAEITTPERFGSVLQFLQSGSHLEEIVIDTEAESVSNYRDDVVACLALMKAADSSHFKGMFDAVRPGGKGADGDGSFDQLCEVLDSKSPLGDTSSPQASP